MIGEPASTQRAGPGRCRRRGRVRWSGTCRRRCRCRRAARCRASVRWVACTAVERGPSAPCSCSSWVGRDAVRVQAGLVLAPAARTGGRAAARRARWPTPRPGASARRGRRAPSGSPRRPPRRPRAVRTRRERLDPRRPRRRRRRRRTAAATPSSGGADAAGQVAGVQQRDPQPGLARGLRPAPGPSRSGRRTARRPGRGAGSGTRPTQVIPASAISAYDGPGQREVAVRVQPRRPRRTSARARSRSVPAARLRRPAQRAVEGVRVRVGQARAGSARAAGRRPGRRSATPRVTSAIRSPPTSTSTSRPRPRPAAARPARRQ